MAVNTSLHLLIRTYWDLRDSTTDEEEREQLEYLAIGTQLQLKEVKAIYLRQHDKELCPCQAQSCTAG